MSRRPLPPGRTAALLFAGVLAVIAVLSGAGMILRGGELELFVHYWNGHVTISFAALGFIQIFVAIAMTWALVTRSRLSKIEMDDGGVRWSRGSARGYVPFASIRDAAISSGAIGGSTLTLAMGDTGERVRLPLSEDDNPSDLLAAILRRVVRGEGAAPGPSAVLLRRGRRDLSGWLTAVRDATALRAEDAYRSPAIDFDALASVLADPRGDVELRAAAAHALALSSDPAHRDTAARIACESAPPLVVVAAAIGRPSLLPKDVVDDAVSHLDADDRSAASSLLVADASRVRVAAAHDEEALEQEALEPSRSERRERR